MQRLQPIHFVLEEIELWLKPKNGTNLGLRVQFQLCAL